MFQVTRFFLRPLDKKPRFTYFVVGGGGCLGGGGVGVRARRFYEVK